ncbi:sarcolemmal membrane-associated [Fusarium circinatum]|uniref:Sarcolemmal membrane-associated n=1 Tax=Fusarium circinatum TaxID=48490 RepID=A0A8H5ULS3_FUSCI|nr:sarcolemmal membrane-associated [Fusarium circinatum]
MAVPEYREGVSITLSMAAPPPSFSFPTRRIFLSKKNPTKTTAMECHFDSRTRIFVGINKQSKSRYPTRIWSPRNPTPRRTAPDDETESSESYGLGGAPDSVVPQGCKRRSRSDVTGIAGKTYVTTGGNVVPQTPITTRTALYTADKSPSRVDSKLFLFGSLQDRQHESLDMGPKDICTTSIPLLSSSKDLPTPTNVNHTSLAYR